MKRNTIFEKVKNSYSIYSEIDKIHHAILYNDMFYLCKTDNHTQKVAIVKEFHFFDFCNNYLFKFLPDTGTCLNIKEFMDRAEASLDYTRRYSITEDRIINYLEVLENLFKIYFDRYGYFKRKYGLECDLNLYKEIRFLIDSLEKHMGLSKKEFKDRVILYSENFKLSEALEQVKSSDLAVEIVKYDKEILDCNGKRKILKELDTLVEPIIGKIKKRYGNNSVIWCIADDLSCILNNFNIRHNNCESGSKKYIKNVANLEEQKLCEVYDTAYSLIIDILIWNKYEDDLKKRIETFKSYLT